MGNEGFPGSLAMIIVAAVIGALLVGAFAVGTVINSAVPEAPGALTANVTCAVVGDQVVFSAASTSGGSLPYESFEWDFGDGNTAEGEEAGAQVAHQYSGADTYVAKVVVTDATGNEAAAYCLVPIQ